MFDGVQILFVKAWHSICGNSEPIKHKEEKRQDPFAWLGLILVPASVHIL